MSSAAVAASFRLSTSSQLPCRRPANAPLNSSLGICLPPRRLSTSSRKAARAELSSTEAETGGVESRGTGLKRSEALAEKYAVIDSGKWGCNSCGYVYDSFKGDPNYPVAPGIEFQQLPEDWNCPTCGAAPSSFKSLGREVAGFVQNQKYGFGTNSMTAEQKGLLIWGSLGAAFALFMSGYFIS